jgi:hypothetical protein
MFQIVKVVELAALADYRLRLVFSDGSVGEHDFRPLIDEGGPMVEPLRDPEFFARAFVEMGVPTLPVGRPGRGQSASCHASQSRMRPLSARAGGSRAYGANCPLRNEKFPLA